MAKAGRSVSPTAGTRVCRRCSYSLVSRSLSRFSGLIECLIKSRIECLIKFLNMKCLIKSCVKSLKKSGIRDLIRHSIRDLIRLIRDLI